MKARYILFAIAALAIAACAKTIEQPETTGKQIIIKAYQEGASGTKTTVQDGGTQVFWEPGDEISVFFRGYGSKFTARNTELAAVTEFSGTLLTLVGAQEGNVASNLIWGLYPYRSDATSDGVSVTTTLSTAQTGRAGSFDKHTHICLAASTGLDLAFYNVTGGLRFTLSRDDITSISFKGNKGEALAGKFKLAFADGVPYVTEMLDASDLITLYAPEGETFKPGVWYYIVTLPATLSEGFKMSFNSASCTGLRQTWKEVNIKRGVFGSVENIDEGVEFYALPEAVDLGLPSGTLWASFNVGASKPSEIGGRFAWGETTVKDHYNWDNYKWCNGSPYSMTKYCTRSNYGTVDGKTTLDQEDDAAYVLLGNGWFTPGKAEMEELVSNCEWNQETLDGVFGFRVTGPNSNSIFVPSNGQYDESGLNWPSYVYLWTSETGGDYYAISCGVNQNSRNVSNANHKHDGLCIRPVIRGGTTPEPQDPEFELEAVDLGLPSGLKWASANVGASSPEGTGDYFAWGEVEPRGDIPGYDYAWTIYKWCEGGYGSMIKYNTNPSYGTVDGITVLLKEDDAASYNLGGFWRMPTAEEQDELLQLCSWHWTSRNGVCGYEVVSSINSNSIFLPAAGYKGDDNFVNEAGEVGLYWSSSLTRNPTTFTAYRLRFTENDIDHIDINRSFGLQVRPVWEELSSPEAVDLGLSVKWASMNLGAQTPEECGQFYAWGETVSKSIFSSSTYKWYDSSTESFTKYNIPGIDDRTHLESYDDVARNKLGGNWRMPTMDEWSELLENCTWIWSSLNGVSGFKVESHNNSNSIFFPVTGYRGDDLWINIGCSSHFWASTCTGCNTESANILEFDSDGAKINNHYRRNGLQVRPVCQN